MDRLTNDSNIFDVINDDTFAFQCFLKLKEYEDTGVEPKQIRQMQLRINRLVALVNALRKELGNVVGRFSREETSAG